MSQQLIWNLRLKLKLENETNLRLKLQKQSSRGVLWKTCSKKFHKIYGKNLCHSLFISVAKTSEAVVQRCSMKKMLEISQNSQENTCTRVCFLIKVQASGKETLTQLFSCEFCKISKNTFFTENLWTTTFETSLGVTYLLHATSLSTCVCGYACVVAHFMETLKMTAQFLSSCWKIFDCSRKFVWFFIWFSTVSMFQNCLKRKLELLLTL